MDTTYGVLCLIPPIVAIGLALWTKQTIFSLFIAVWLGSTMMNGFNPLVGFVKIISDYVIPSLSGNASLIVLVTLSGGMIAMLRTTGAAEAFATKVTKVINTAKKGQVVTCLSAFIFSYTEPCLIAGYHYAARDRHGAVFPGQSWPISWTLWVVTWLPCLPSAATAPSSPA